MYLIDTSIWIDYFRDIQNNPIQQFMSILDSHLPFGITGIIYQEILQGASTEKDFNQLKNYLRSQRFFHPRNEMRTYESAAKIFYLFRRKGITIRSTIDCIIAQIAIEHGLILVHNDKDYSYIHSVIPELQLMP